MQGRLIRQNLFAALLVAISILCLTPTLVHSDQSHSFPLTIDAIDQAIAIGNGPAGARTLNLSQNTTETSIVNATSTYDTNSTLSAEATVGNVTRSVTLSGNLSAPHIPQASENITVTVTQYLSETTSMTQTVANVTISYTVTTSVGNRTVTQANVTITVTATTGT
jgi:hypothetical protein